MTTPIVIICYNNYKYVENTISQIVNINKDYVKDIVILNNNSTCEKTIEYLKASPYMVIWNDTNNGPWIAPHVNPHIYNKLPDKFIVTDPDLQFNQNLPTNFIEILNELSEQYSCEKIGFALDISDFKDMYQSEYVQDDSGNILSIYEWEQRFWVDRIQNDTYELYKSPIDTTLCLLNKKNIYNGFNIRIAGHFTAKHLPWYVKNKIYNDYELYTTYINTNKISTFSRLILPYIENKYLKIYKNNEIFLIENDTRNPNLTFWKDIYVNWEHETFSIFDTYLKKDKICIDIGGWIGTTMMYASRKSKHVYCIEADKESFADLTKNCEINLDKNYTLLNNAIYHTSTIDVKFGKNKFLKNSKLNDSTSQLYSDDEVLDDYSIIKTITLNDIVKNYAINWYEISLIKVDIEGGEEYILKELYEIHKIYNIPLYVSFHYDWWKNKDLDRFEFLNENQKQQIRNYPFTSILYVK